MLIILEKLLITTLKFLKDSTKNHIANILWLSLLKKESKIQSLD